MKFARYRLRYCQQVFCKVEIEGLNDKQSSQSPLAEISGIQKNQNHLRLTLHRFSA